MSTAKRLLAFLGGWVTTFLIGLFVGGDLFWALYWLCWFFVVFMVPEVYWVVVNSRYTVSEETWRFESLNKMHPFIFTDWTASHWVFAAVYLVGAILLGLHLVFGFKLFLVYG